MPVDKIGGVSVSAISKINGVAIADIKYWNMKIVTNIPVPTGLIIPYNSDGADPSGWNTWTDADGFHIIGAGDTYAVDDTAATEGEVTKTTDGGGAHSGSTTRLGSGAGPSGSDSEDDHTHTADFTYTPPYQASRLIKAEAGETSLPQSGVILSSSSLVSSGLSNIWTDDYMFKADTALGTGGTNSITSITTSTEEDHDHGSTKGTTGGADRDSFTSKASGSHSHTITIAISNTLRQYALSLWEHASNAYDIESGMIGMYESLTPPADWSLCNGDGVTPDLRDYFIVPTATGSEGASGDGTIIAATASMTHSSHTHVLGSEANSDQSTGLHGNYTMTPHALSANYTWLPAYYALAFIMKD